MGFLGWLQSVRQASGDRCRKISEWCKRPAKKRSQEEAGLTESAAPPSGVGDLESAVLPTPPKRVRLEAPVEVEKAPVAAEPKRQDSSKSDHEQKEDYEEVTKRRGVLFKKHQEEEDALYKKRDTANAEAAKLMEDANKLWEAGQKDECKAAQAKAKELREQAKQVKEEAVKMDEKHSKEMFEYVQTEEHKGQARDGTWIDLHGLSAAFSETKVREFVDNVQKNGISRLEIITGAGNHSGKDGPVIKGKIFALLKSRGVAFEEETAGSVIAKFS